MRTISIILFSLFLISKVDALTTNFVYLNDIAPSIIEDLRYATSNNFIGHPVPGYKNGRCILTRQAALQLAKAQITANKMGYSLKIYDCYRPQRAVKAFYQWSQTADDKTLKKLFYPREDKSRLFDEGYIALFSGHSRGSTVDLTLVKLGSKESSFKPKNQLCYGQNSDYLDDNSINMGTRFDCLDKSAHLVNPDLCAEQKANRRLLQQLMKANGFRGYSKEWWHFTLNKEPYPHRYFDFLVE